jgi:hypothetical protein
MIKLFALLVTPTGFKNIYHTLKHAKIYNIVYNILNIFVYLIPNFFIINFNNLYYINIIKLKNIYKF